MPQRTNGSDPFRDTGLSSHMEDYVEAIVMLSAQNPVVRVKDIAAKLCITMPSVSAALAKLKEMGLIDYEKYGYVTLTERGRELAERVLMRHNCLIAFFTTLLQMSGEAAESEACRVEHVLEPDTCDRIRRLLDFFRSEERSNREWVDRLKKALR